MATDSTNFQAADNYEPNSQAYAPSNNPAIPSMGAFINGQPDNLGYCGTPGSQMGYESGLAASAALGGVNWVGDINATGPVANSVG